MENSTILDSVVDIEYTTTKSEPTIITNDKEFNEAKQEILKCFYVGIHKKANALSVVCDNGKYYVMNMDTISKDSIVSTFNSIKPKKVGFDISHFKDIINKNSKGFIDIKLAINLLINKDFKTLNELILGLKMPSEGRSNVYLLYANFIKIIKNINIYIERNRLNKIFYTEMDTATLMCNIAKRGLDIKFKEFEKFKERVEREVDSLVEEGRKKYGHEFDYSDKKKILKAVKEGSRSLEPNIMNISNNPLYVEYKKYALSKWLKTLDIRDDKIYFDYSLYEDFQIKSSLLIKGNFYGSDKVQVIKGEFGNLYYKVFAELTKDDNLIAAASENNLIGYINTILFHDQDQSIFPYTAIILNCYTNGIFDHFKVQEYALENYDTVLNVGDISNFNYRIKEKLESFYEFIQKFNGLSPEYDRYNKKIFTPNSSLDKYIKQIVNVIFKLSLLEIEDMSRDYSEKKSRGKDDNIVLSGVGKDFILLSVSGDDARQIAIDNLNRVMYKHFKYFIKNTKVHNITSPLGV